MKGSAYHRLAKGAMGTALMLSLCLPLLGRGFDLNQMNSFYQTGKCPKCDLSYATFLNLRSPGSNLAESRCTGIKLVDAVLDHSDLNGADFSHARLFGADLRGARLVKANLKGANLVIADLSGADLTDANLTDANLKGANLSGASIQGADFSGATWPDWGRCGQGSVGQCRK